MDLQALIDEKDDEILSDVEELETPLHVMDLETGQRESPSDETDRQADQVDSTTSQKKEFYGRVSAQEHHIAQRICDKINEKKLHLMRQLVRFLGIPASLEVLSETLKVEANGGMMCNDNKRRREPGGVFLTFIEKRISREDMKKIRDGCKPEEKRLIQQLKAKRKSGKAAPNADPLRGDATHNRAGPTKSQPPKGSSQQRQKASQVRRKSQQQHNRGDAGSLAVHSKLDDIKDKTVLPSPCQTKEGKVLVDFAAPLDYGEDEELDGSPDTRSVIAHVHGVDLPDSRSVYDLGF